MHEAVTKWSKKLEKLSSQVVNDYKKGIQTYLETLIPPPKKTNRIKQRWQRVKERRQHLLQNFNSEAFFQWFLDPTRPKPSLEAEGPASSEAKGFAVHIKVATSPEMLETNHAKVVHSSHSVYSMSLHGFGRLSTMLVALHDPELALEFKTFRADVSHIVIRAPGHLKMDELKSQVAEKVREWHACYQFKNQILS